MLKSDPSFFSLCRKVNAAVVIVIMSISLLGCFSMENDRARLAEVKSLWSSFPLYEGMVEIRSSEQSGFGKAFISKTFLCRAPYEAVKEFYLSKLRDTGWRLSEEKDLKNWRGQLTGKHLAFFKDGYEITIENDDVTSNGEWNYGIGIGWAGRSRD